MVCREVVGHQRCAGWLQGLSFLVVCREGMGIGRDVMLNGMLSHFEIWDKTAWQEEAKLARESFEEFSDGLATLGML